MPAFFTNLSITSLGFFVFVPIILGIYYLVPQKHQNLILLLGSYLFCFTWGLSFVIPLLIYSIINYLIALKIDASQKSKNYWLWTGIILNLIGLIIYKYSSPIQYFTSRALPRLGVEYEYSFIQILQPIGVSFYVLQAISYLIDISRKQINANKSFIETSLYLSYFPKLIAGPLERAGNFFKQLQSIQEINNQTIIQGFTKIIVGLVRKIVISETILESIPADVFSKPEFYSAPTILFWWLAFAFVIYNDFAGYTNIAQGISKLFGIELSHNFQQPFLSISFIDFWNRWHISLSSWLRDYIYLPISRWMLHRNSSGKYLPNLIIPPLLTMIVSGIWHGASFHFILWGMLNGLVQGIERIQKSRKKITKDKSSIFKQSLNIFGTILVLVLISVPFKFDINQSIEIWKNLITWKSVGFTLSLNVIIKPVIAICLSFIIDVFQFPNNNEEKIIWLPQRIRVFIMATVLLLLFLSSRQQVLTPFIYQEF